jgi:hypothetical protein
MTLAEYIEQGGNPDDFKMCQVEFERNTVRCGKHMATARFEGLDTSGKAIVRHNGVQENAWYLPYHFDPAIVHLVVKDDKPVPYDSRPMTQ